MIITDSVKNLNYLNNNKRAKYLRMQQVAASFDFCASIWNSILQCKQLAAAVLCAKYLITKCQKTRELLTIKGWYTQVAKITVYKRMIIAEEDRIDAYNWIWSLNFFHVSALSQMDACSCYMN